MHNPIPYSADICVDSRTRLVVVAVNVVGEDAVELVTVAVRPHQASTVIILTRII